MRRLFLTSFLLLLSGGAAVLLHSAVLPEHAAAAKCLTCEEEGGGEVEAQILTIEIAGQGAVKNGTKTYCENTGFSPKSCEVELAEGKEVTLTATPLGEYVFQGWSGACSGSGNCEVTMSEAKSVKATFTNPPPSSPVITSPTSGQVFERTAEEPIGVSFTDSDSTVVGFRCHLDSGSNVSCSSPWTTPKLSAGEHTVTVSAVDGANNLSSTIRAFKVVINAPPAEEEGKEPPKEEGGSGSGGGITPGTGDTASTAPPPSVAPAIAARAVVKSHLLGSSTVLRKLALKGLPAGASVAATCKGKGCPFKRKQVKVAGGAADLSALFAKHELGPGALIELKATAPGMTGETVDVKTRAGKAPRVITS